MFSPMIAECCLQSSHSSLQSALEACLFPIAEIHRCRAAGTALVMAADEFHLGVLTTPKAAISQYTPLI